MVKLGDWEMDFIMSVFWSEFNFLFGSILIGSIIAT